ncbi:hypothetical protein FKM82_006979 [Ascaphus truei]
MPPTRLPVGSPHPISKATDRLWARRAQCHAHAYYICGLIYSRKSNFQNLLQNMGNLQHLVSRKPQTARGSINQETSYSKVLTRV